MDALPPADVSVDESTVTPPRTTEAHSAIFYWHLVRRQQWKITTFVLLVTTVGALICLQLPKVYGATAVVRVDPAAGNSMDSTSRTAAAPVDATLLTTTEAQIVTSPNNVLAAAHALNLGADPYYLRKIGPLRSGETLDERLLQVLGPEVSVTQPFNTELMLVHVEAYSPTLASNLANELANAYVRNEYRSRAQALVDASQSMATQLASLRAEMERDQEALVTYEASHDVLDADDKQNIYAAQLTQVNQDLGVAQADRIRLEADYRVAQSGNLEALLALPMGAPLVPLRNQLVLDQHQLARIATIDGPKHPLYRQQAAVVSHDRTELATQAQDIVQQIQIQFQNAALREEMIQAALNREKQAMDAFNMRSIQYHALKAAADNSSNLYYSLQQHMQDSAVAATLRGDDLQIVSPARVDTKPTAPKPLLDTALLFFFSLVAAIGGAISLGVLDRSLASPEQVEHWVSLPVVAMLPLASGQASIAGLRPSAYLTAGVADGKALGEGEGPEGGQRGGFYEAVTSLHSTLSFSMGDSPLVLSVVSALPGEGKSTLAANLAAVYARLSGATIVIDADLRKPSVHRAFGVSNAIGLSTVLRGRASLEQAIVSVAKGLAVLPSGPVVVNPVEMLHRQLGEIVEQLQASYSAIIIDSPPVLGFADYASITRTVHATLLVVAAGQTQRAMVAAAKRQLQSVGANIVGVVLNRVSAKLNPYYEYYSKHYDSYYADGDESGDQSDS